MGHWQAAVPTDGLTQADGVYVLSAQVIGASGNSPVATRQFTVDTVAPDAPSAPALDPASDTGPARDGTITDQPLPTVTGTAEPFATIKLYDADAADPTKPIGTATADQNGVYTLNLDEPAINGTGVAIPVPPPVAPTPPTVAGGTSGMSPELFYALLSLDSYNRGYGSGLDVAAVGPQFATSLGDATIGSTSTDLLGLYSTKKIGFFAQTYVIGGKTVISYRGTDNFGAGNPVTGANDVVNGWITGLGFASTQSDAALQFYDQVTGSTLASGPDANVVLTGHSLGGGLAGYVSALQGGDTAYLYDNEPYAWAAVRYAASYNQAHPSTPIALPTGAASTSEFTFGEVLSGVRTETGEFVTQLVDALAVIYQASPGSSAPDIDVDAAEAIPGQQTNRPALAAYSGLPNPLDAISLHSVAELAVLQYASDNNLTAWLTGQVGADLFDSEFNDGIGAAIGLQKGGNGVAGPAAKMLDMIAYSAIPEGAQPYGDTGIVALFAGGDTLGTLYAVPNLEDELTPANVELDLAEIDVAYAGWLAENQDENGNHQAGQIAYSVVAQSLTVDMSDVYWQVYDATTGLTAHHAASSIVGWTDLLTTLSLGALTPGAIGTVQRLVVATGAGATLTAPELPGQTVLIASESGTTITGSSGDDDIVSFDIGSNAIDGAGGVNEVFYNSASSAYVLVQNADGSFTLDKPGGSTDTLRDIQYLHFAGGVIFEITDTGPVLGLVDGLHQLTVSATDPAGNISAMSDALTLTVDTVAPPAPIAAVAAASDTGTSNSDGVTSDQTPTITGSAEAGSLVTLYDSDGTTQLGTAKADPTTGAFSLTSAGLSEGEHALRLQSTDPAGNVSPYSSTLFVTVDTTAPAAPVITGFVVNGSNFAYDIVGTAEPDSLVTLQGSAGGPALGQTSAGDDGTFDILVADLPTGTQLLTATATDQAGNVSTASAAYEATVTSPDPSLIILTGTLSDGPIANATVFADANGNGVDDAGEAATITTTAGQFTLAGPSGELVSSGGTDTQTGVALPGALTAPAGSTVIDPLTTLLDAYATATGQTVQAAQPALLTLLGLDPTADLTQVDPEAAATGGDLSFLVANARLMDTAVNFTDLIVAQTGIDTSTAFAAVFSALAQQAAAGKLNLDDFPTLEAVLANAAATAVSGTVVPANLLQGSAAIVDYGNTDLASAATPGNGVTSQAFVDAVERVDQGQAAPQFAEYGADPESEVGGLYTNALSSEVSIAETPILTAPVLAPASDTGVSDRDNATADTAITFTGTAAPGANVILVSEVRETQTTTIIGSGTADAGGAYAIAATLGAGIDFVVAEQAAPGEDTTVGSAATLPTGLIGSQVTQLLVGDDPQDEQYDSLPQIQEIEYTASSANTATATSLYVTGSGSGDIQTGATFTVTANGIPVSAGTASSDYGSYGVLTTALTAGTYSLVVTETALDGETLQSKPTTIIVVAPGSLSVTAESSGPLAGGSIFPAGGRQAEYVGAGSASTYPGYAHPNATTDASGNAVVALLGSVSYPNSTTVYSSDSDGLAVTGGEDTVLGLTIPLELAAPVGATVIDPATSLLEEADIEATAPLTLPDAVDYAFENRLIDTALGMPTTLDLGTADPLAMAEAGNDTLFLKDIELQDTEFLLTPFSVDGDGGISSADPLYIIDKSLPIYPFEAIINDKPPAITVKPIDFTNAATVLAWMTTYDTTPIFGSYDTVFDSTVLPIAAAIIAASNAAIEAHTAAATSEADAISYALAVEKTAFSGEQQAFQELASSFYFSVTTAQQQAGFAALQAEYTGAGLAAAVAATLAQTVQVTGFTAAASTAAAYTTFTITFSKPVGGITADDFTLSESAGLAGATITAVTPVAGSNGASYTVTASTGVGTGTLTLDFTPSSVTNVAGLPLGSGDFSSPTNYGSPTTDEGGSASALSLAIGDFTGDGRPDIVTANASVDGLTLYVNTGGGTFTAEPAVYTGPSEPLQVAIGDFDGDGKLDALTLNTTYNYEGDETVSALLGNGDGTFGAPIQTDIGPNAQEVLTGDFTGDGKLDLAILGNAHYYTDSIVQIFDGNGGGTFTPGASFDLGSPVNTNGSESKDMVEADLNGDGHPDLVIATATLNTFAANAVVLLGDGHGGFTEGAPIALGFGSSATLIAIGDVNGDGIPDIVAIPQETAGAETAEILLGKGDGTFGPATTVALPLPPGGAGTTINGDDTNTAVTIGDVTGDGHADIVVGNDETGVVVVPGNGDGTFGTGFVAEPGTGVFYGTLALADVNGDSLPDLVDTDTSGAYESSSVSPGVAVALNTQQTVLPATASTAVTRAAQAQPILVQSSGPGTLAQSGNSYTLNLGTVSQGSTVTAVLALLNAAAAPADSFDGSFTAAAGSGFAFTGTDLSSAVAAGQSYAGLTVAADTGTLGAHSETITFAPRDVTDDPALTETLSAADGDTTAVTLPSANAAAPTCRWSWRRSR